MAQRRMFSLKVVDTDAFMDMPLSAQALYFHLGMRADDDGFVSNARRIQRLVGAADDDLKLLLMKRFILAFDGSSVIVIKHWRLNNYVKGDRYNPTLYQEEKNSLFVKPNGVYTDHPLPQATPPAPLPGASPDSDGAPVEQAVMDYLQDRGSYIPAYFGVTEKNMSDAELFATALFKQWTNRAPTKEDISRVFLATRRQEKNPTTQEWKVTYPQEDRNLLMYAFEQAAAAGKPGDWNYIQGVLRKLRQRDIKTLDQADSFDFERDTQMERW